MGKTYVNSSIKLGAGLGNGTNGLFATLSPYGDGSDGDVTISVDTTLARDMFYNNLTINNGITLSPAGFKIFVKGVLNCVGTGKVAANGGAGGDGTSSPGGGANGTPGIAGTKAYNDGGTLPNTLPGLAAGAISTAGNNGVSVAKTLSPSNAAAGGAGGGGQSDVFIPGKSGGSAGTITSAPLTRPYSVSTMTQLYDLISGTLTMYTNVPSSGSGASGINPGWGGGLGGAGGGGGSGAPGGFIWIAASNITNLNVESNGGNGGNGGGGQAGGGHDGGSGGGGGGGNGGIILIFYSTKTTVTASVAGGTGGIAGTVGYAGVNGSNGNTGLLKQINL